MRIYQVMDALDYGDGVSNKELITLLLNKMGMKIKSTPSGGTSRQAIYHGDIKTEGKA